MKKRNLKSLGLNKKTISTLETSKVNGGSITASMTCTMGYICIGVIVAAHNVGNYLNDVLNQE